jgi:hypothetical protein
MYEILLYFAEKFKNSLTQKINFFMYNINLVARLAALSALLPVTASPLAPPVRNKPYSNTVLIKVPTYFTRPWGPPILLCNGYRVFPGGKATEA